MVNFHSGGLTGQAQAIRHEIARALFEADLEDLGKLKRTGLLTHELLMKERYKYSFKKVRRSSQFSKG